VLRPDYAATRAAYEALGRAIDAAARAPAGDWRHGIVTAAVGALCELVRLPAEICSSAAITAVGHYADGAVVAAVPSEHTSKEQGR
jgi:hypothetical protein